MAHLSAACHHVTLLGGAAAANVAIRPGRGAAHCQRNPHPLDAQRRAHPEVLSDWAIEHVAIALAEAQRIVSASRPRRACTHKLGTRPA
jgi:hypothetical protein